MPLRNLAHSGRVTRPSARRRFFGVIAASVAMTVLAACGQPETGATGDQVRNEDETQGVTDDTIKIGVFSVFSGPNALFSKAASMAIAVYEAKNAEGGINGRQIEVVTADGACDPATVQSQLRKFIDQEQVFMIHGGSCSDVVVSNRSIIEQSGIPFLSLNATSAAISDPPLVNLFHPKPTPDEKGTAIAEFLASNPDVQQVGLVAAPDQLGRDVADATSEALEAVGLEAAADVELANEAGDATAQVQQLLRAEVDAISPTVQPQAMTSLLRDAYAQGLRVPIVTTDIARPDEQVARLSTRAPAELHFGEYLFEEPISSEKYAEFRALLTESDPELAFDAFALEGVTSAQMNIQALEAMGDDLTWGAWIDAMEATQFDTSTSGSVSFSEFDPQDPGTRRAELAQRWAVLDPCTEGEELIVVEDWPGYSAAKEEC